jgi:hypothetical protein
VDFTSYAELAVRLVNTDCPDHGYRDGLDSVDGYQAFTAGHPQLHSCVIPGDLVALGHLKAELRQIFRAAAGGQGEEAVSRLNALLIRYPFHPEIASMTASRGTCISPRTGRRPIDTPPGRSSA